VVVLCQFQADFGSFGMKEGSKWVQLHIKWTVWCIHTRLILVSFCKFRYNLFGLSLVIFFIQKDCFQLFT
jgi:hypothetical protein